MHWFSLKSPFYANSELWIERPGLPSRIHSRDILQTSQNEHHSVPGGRHDPWMRCRCLLLRAFTSLSVLPDLEFRHFYGEKNANGMRAFLMRMLVEAHEGNSKQRTPSPHTAHCSTLHPSSSLSWKGPLSEVIHFTEKEDYVKDRYREATRLHVFRRCLFE